MARPLIIRLCNWVGEAVLALPGLLALEEAGYELHVIGKKWSQSLLAGHGWAIHVRPAKRADAIAQLRQLKRELSARDKSFARRPNVVLLTNSFSSALECRLAGLRPVGNAGEGRALFLSRSIPRAPGIHAAAQYARITAILGGEKPLGESRLRVDPLALQRAEKLLQTHGVSGQFAILCPFSGAADTTGKKQWPDFPELAKLIHSAGWRVVLCPGPGEEPQAQSGYADGVVMKGVDLGTYAALLTMADFAVSNDTGPGHIAAAVGCRVFGVYGPGSIRMWAPVGPAVSLLICDGRWPTLQEVWTRIQQEVGGAS